MNSSKPNPNLTCLAAFALGRYAECVAAGFKLLQESVSPEVLQVTVISMLRISRPVDAQKLVDLTLPTLTDIDRSLLQVSTGRGTLDDAFAAMTTDLERCRAHYYFACRWFTLGQPLEAWRELNTCLDAEDDCLERKIARIECRRRLMDDSEEFPGDWRARIKRLNREAETYANNGLVDTATDMSEKALHYASRYLGEEDVDYAQCLSNVAALYATSGKLEEAQTMLQRAAMIIKRAPHRNSAAYAAVLHNLARLSESKASSSEAEVLYEAAIEEWHTTQGDNDPHYALMLFSLGCLYSKRREFRKAAELFNKALTIQRRSPTDPDYAETLNALGELHYQTGEYISAQIASQQAIHTLCSGVGDSDPRYALYLNTLAAIYQAMGRSHDAEALLKQVITILEMTSRHRTSAYASALSNLGTVYMFLGRNAEAEAAMNRAVELKRAIDGESSTSYATGLNNLAVYYAKQGRFRDATNLYHESLNILRAALGNEHPALAAAVFNLGEVVRKSGDYSAAKRFHEEGVAIGRSVLGEGHPDFMHNLSALAQVHAAMNEPTAAILCATEAIGIGERMIQRLLFVSNAQQREALLDNLEQDFHRFVTLALRYGADFPNFIDVIFTLVQRRKAIGANATATQRLQILSSQSPTLKQLLKRLIDLQQRIARKTIVGPVSDYIKEHSEVLQHWTAQKRELEIRLSEDESLLAALTQMEQSTRPTDIAKKLESDSILIEFIKIHICDFAAIESKYEATWKDAHYVAITLSAADLCLKIVDIGNAAQIDALIEDFRYAILDEAAKPAFDGKSTVAGARLKEALFSPIEATIGDCHRLYLAPDGNLARLPFEALPTKQGRALIDDYRLTYLSVGRELLRYASSPCPNNQSSAVVIADPDFDLQLSDSDSAGLQSYPAENNSTIDLSRIYFKRLPGTRNEGIRIAALLNVKPWLDNTALESRLKSLRSPKILHIATHGFFIEDGEDNRFASHLPADGEQAVSSAAKERANPMLRSGIALSGANWKHKRFVPYPEAEDGVITAEDVVGLDLRDTELVVLSACDTGLGEIHDGEGVMGLRRAFAIAGTRTLIMSLWKVPDLQTQQLMEMFYTELKKGTPRGDALRQAQLGVRQQHPQPYYWAAFICQGDCGPLTL